MTKISDDLGPARGEGRSIVERYSLPFVYDLGGVIPPNPRERLIRPLPTFLPTRFPLRREPSTRT